MGQAKRLKFHKISGTDGSYLGQFIAPIEFNLTGGLAFDHNGFVFVSTSVDSSVLQYDAHTGALIKTLVPSGAGGLVDAQGIGIGPDGNLYVAGAFSDAIHRYDMNTGAFIDIFASGPIDAPQFFVFVPEPSVVSMTILASVLLLGRDARRIG